MSALGATTNDLSSLMSLQAALAENGVPPQLILETLRLLLQSEGGANSGSVSVFKDIYCLSTYQTIHLQE